MGNKHFTAGEIAFDAEAIRSRPELRQKQTRSISRTN